MISLGKFNETIFFWINQDGGHHYAWLDASMVFLSDATSGVIPLYWLRSSHSGAAANLHGGLLR